MTGDQGHCLRHDSIGLRGNVREIREYAVHGKASQLLELGLGSAAVACRQKLLVYPHGPDVNKKTRGVRASHQVRWRSERTVTVDWNDESFLRRTRRCSSVRSRRPSPRH